MTLLWFDTGGYFALLSPVFGPHVLDIPPLMYQRVMYAHNPC